MSYQFGGMPDSQVQTCQYKGSARWFRGPGRSLNAPFVACVGGDETFGRFVDLPFPAVLEKRLTKRCVNLGSLFCGIEALTKDIGLQEILNRSETCILQLPGIAGQSNAYYRVHPNRNDRFLQPTPRLKALYPEVDFTEFHFVRHLLGKLHAQCGTRFEQVVQALQIQWIEGLTGFLSTIQVPVILVHLRHEIHETEGEGDAQLRLSVEPAMLEALTPFSTALTEISVNPSALSDDIEDVIFGTMQQPIAEHVIGPATHRRVASELASVVRDVE